MPPRMLFWMILLSALLAACQPGRQIVTPLDYPSALEQASTLIGRHDFEPARRELEALTASSPGQAAAWRLLGGLHDLEERFDLARLTFEQGLRSVSPSADGYPDLALQAALFAGSHPDLGLSGTNILEPLPDADLRRSIVEASGLLRSGETVKGLKLLNSLLTQQPPASCIGDIYFLAAQGYQALGEPTYVNESLFHAVNFSKSPILTLRIERLWGKPR